jgi:D-alanyl-D-alanine carboxypeptidase (penicillin-binding protein 5/6)
MDLDTVAVVSQNAAAQPKVHLGMSEGEQYYLRDLLYAMMLESFNDCAVAIAETVAGTTENFAKMMNQKAQLLGCKDTYFITPNGLDAEDEFGFHHTTAEDLCRIMSYCVWNSPKADEFLKITQTSEYQFQSLEGKNCTAVNRNAFLHMMDGVLSGKTGFTANAGYCYVAALEKDGRKFCIALLACGWPNNRTYKWSDAKKLLQYALDCYHYADVEQVTELPEITVRNAKTRQSSLKDFRQNMLIVPIADDSQLPKQYLLKDGQQITHQILVNQEVTAPVKEDDIVGEIDYYLDDELIAQLPVYAGCNLQSWDFSALMKSLVMKYLL